MPGVRQLLVAALVVAASCGGPGAAPEDPGSGGPAGTPAPHGPPAQVRRIEAGEHPFSGPLARGREGDWLLDNGVVAFVVDDPPRSQATAATGGNVVDAGASGGGRDDLGGVVTMLDDDPSRAAMYETAAPETGGDGTARLVVEGFDSRNPYVKLVTTYSLAPGSRALGIETRIDNLHELDDLIDFEVGDRVAWNGASPWVEGLGWFHEGSFDAPWLAAAGEEATYAYVAPEGGLWGEAGPLGARVNVAYTAIKRESSATVVRWLGVLPGEGVEAAAALARDLAGRETVTPEVPLPGGGGRLEVATGGPARVLVRGRGDTPDPLLGLVCTPGATANALVSDGSAAVDLPAGSYRVSITRGPEYSLHVEDVEVSEGSTVRVEASLVRLFASPGALAADLRTHSLASPDSCMPVSGRWLSARAEGLEVVALTDVNTVTEPGPIPDGLMVITGQELVTDLSGRPVGRFSVWPLEPDPAAGHGGALPWFNQSVDDIVASAHDIGALVQVNHPRGPEAGYLDLVGFDRGAPASSIESIVEPGLDCMELWSGKDVKQRGSLIRDWMRLLRLGRAITATAGTGATGLWGAEPGYPRTYVLVDDPGSADVDDVMDALQAHRAVVSSGPFLTISVGKTGVGGFAKKAGKTVKVSWHLESAPWTRVDEIEILVGGERWGDPIDVPEPAGGPTSTTPQIHDGTVTVKLSGDDVIVAVARGTMTFAPALPDRPAVTPWAMTNPIWIDANKNGKFDPPEVE